MKAVPGKLGCSLQMKREIKSQALQMKGFLSRSFQASSDFS